MIINTIEYIVLKTEVRTHNAVSVFLSTRDGYIPAHEPGQYLVVYFFDTAHAEGKAYSIASKPGEPLELVVRVMGEYSSRLASMKPGDKIRASHPYGFFTTQESAADIALVASGVGIVPFISVLRTRQARTLYVFRSDRTAADVIYMDEVVRHATESHQFITRESGTDPAIQYRRMFPQDVFNGLRAPLHTEIMLCGSIGFVRDMWRGLRASGVPEQHMCTEAFFK